MANFRKWMERLGIALLVLVAVLAVLWGLSRALYPTAEQRDALALMQQPPPPPGENAFAAMWTLDRAVPPDEMARVIELDAARIAGLSQFPDPDDPTAKAFASAAEQYPDLAPLPEDRDLFCNPERENCVAKVAADVATYRALIARNSRLIDRIDALADYDYVRQQLPWNMTASILMPRNATHSATRNALWFAEGQIDDALAASCRGIATWRRLGASADTLMLRLTANAFAVKYYGKVLADMLAELPVDHPLPAACKPALAPPSPHELSLCTAMRGELEMLEAIMPASIGEASLAWYSMLTGRIGYNIEASHAALAERLAPVCSNREFQRIAADEPEIEPPSPEAYSIWRFECIGNYVGCAIASIQASAPAYNSFRIRMQDFGARIKLLGTLAWLREHADRPGQLEAVLAQRPEALKSPTRQVEIGEDGGSLQIQMFSEFVTENASVPLPEALRR